VEIERLKEQVSLVSLVTAHGVELRKTGKDMVGRCPFHDDPTPSLVVTPAKNLWHCLGACQAGGSVVDWVMRAQGVSFRHAAEPLRDGMPTTASSTSGTGAPKRSTVRTLPAPVTQTSKDGELLAQVVGYYARVLTESPEALEFLRRRKLAHPEVLTTFQLGYANRTLGLRLPDNRRNAVALVLARSAPRRLQRARLGGVRGDRADGVADRRAHVVLRRVPACHGLLRHRGVHHRPRRSRRQETATK
jgi:DNA primase